MTASNFYIMTVDDGKVVALKTSGYTIKVGGRVFGLRFSEKGFTAYDTCFGLPLQDWDGVLHQKTLRALEVEIRAGRYKQPEASFTVDELIAAASFIHYARDLGVGSVPFYRFENAITFGACKLLTRSVFTPDEIN